MLLTRNPPRLAPKTLQRGRLMRWLSVQAGVPQRLIVAPAGSGKTTLALHYLAESDRHGAYCALEPGAGAAAVLAGVAQALNLAKKAPAYVDVLVAMRQAATARPLDLVVDDADNAAPEGLDLLRRFVDNLPEGVSLVYCARSREALDAGYLVSSGRAALCDARRIAFDREDIALFADACGVSYGQADVTRLLEESDGWAVVASGAIRAAAEDERSLRDAYEQWRTTYGELFLDFVIAESQRASDEDRALVASLINGVGVSDAAALRRLEARGLFVVNDGSGVRPLRAVQQSRALPTRGVETSVPMNVRLLGRFRVTIGGRDIEWVRRRDRQIFKYLLLRPGAAATREEIASVFWPDAKGPAAMQSVRTACSNIRKAVAGAIGYARVDRYFRADHTVVVDLSNTVTDVGRFTAHSLAGDAAYERVGPVEAAPLYEAAEKAYAGRLLEDESTESWFAGQAQTLEMRFAIVLERLAEAAYEAGDIQHAAEYAYRARLINPEQPQLVRLLSQIKEARRP